MGAGASLFFSGIQGFIINMRLSWILVLVSPNLLLKEMGLDLV